jgi:peptidoglycan/LPS O-acetylase OafA/YrhL
MVTTQPHLTPGTGMEPNRNIEHLRAFAILFVLCSHFTFLPLPEILLNAWSGVDLFLRSQAM